MPSIKITEKDISWYYRQRDNTAMTIYCPIIASYGPTEPTLVTSVSELNQIYRGATNAESDYSFQMVASYLEEGFSVLCQRVVTDGAKKAHYGSATNIIVNNYTSTPYTLTLEWDKNYDYEVPAATVDDQEQLVSAGSLTITDEFILDPNLTDVSPTNPQPLTYDNLLSQIHSADVDTTKVTVSIGEVENDEVAVIVNNKTAGKISVTLGGESQECNVGENTFTIAISEAVTIDTLNQEKSSIEAQYIVVDTSSAVVNFIGDTNDPDNFLTIDAKYAGSIGNGGKIFVKFRGDGSKRYMFVYLGEDELVESLVVDFEDKSSPDYYLTLESEYIVFTPSKDFKFSSSFIDSNTTYTLTGGTDFESPETAHQDTLDKIIETIDSDSKSFTELLDPFNYEFDIIVSNGFNDYDTIAKGPTISKIDEAYTNTAKGKGNAIYLVEGRPDSWDSPDPDDTLPAQFFKYCGVFNTSYAAGIGPWCNSVLVSTGQIVHLPGTYAFLITWGNSVSAGNPWWYAPAGVTRATVTTVKSPDYQVGKSVYDQWQGDPDSFNYDGYRVNPIMKLKQYGYVVNGNSTLLKDDYSGGMSLLNQFSIRVLVNMIKNQAFDISLEVQFDQMTDDLFLKYKVLLGTYLDQLKYSGALYDYEIVMDTANTYTSLNTRTVPVIIRISPIPALESLDITLEINKAGVTFTESEVE